MRKGNHFAVVSKRVNRLLKEHRRQGVLALLGELGFHAADGGTEEESDKVLVCAFCANLFEGRDNVAVGTGTRVIGAVIPRICPSD